jgi:hypothetical protein
MGSTQECQGGVSSVYQQPTVCLYLHSSSFHHMPDCSFKRAAASVHARGSTFNFVTGPAQGGGTTAHALCRACDPSKLSKTARCHGRHNGSRLLE